MRRPLVHLALAGCLVFHQAHLSRADEPVAAKTVEGALLLPAAIVAGGYVAPDGSIQRNVAIIISDGKIKDIIPSEKFSQIEGVARRPEAVVSPGLVDLRSAIGAYGKARESLSAIDPGASAIDSLDLRHPDFHRALADGITTVLLAPDPNNVVSGAAVVVKTAGTERAILREEGPLMLALGPTTWEYDREPTSRIGALAMLRQALSDAKEGRGHKRMQAFAKGSSDAFAYCGEPMDVSAALRTLSGYTTHFNVIYRGDEPELVSELGGAGVGVVVGPYAFDTSPRELSMAGRFATAGVSVAIAANMPSHSGDALRTSASLAVRYGMDAGKARQAITAAPAAMAGVGDRVGAIKPGLDADLVIFSDDPLRLDSRVLEVYVNGVRVYHDESSF